MPPPEISVVLPARKLSQPVRIASPAVRQSSRKETNAPAGDLRLTPTTANYRQAGFRSDDSFHAVVGYGTSGNVACVGIKEVVTTGIKRPAGQRDAGGIV